MKKILFTLSITIFIFFTNSYAKSKSQAEWFVGIGATVTGSSSAMVPSSTYSSLYFEEEYESSLSGGADQLSIHIGYIWDIYDGIEISYSQLGFSDSSDNEEGVATIVEIDRIIGFQDWNIGFTNQEIDLIVPFMKIGFGLASWSDNDATTSEDISGTVGKVSLGLLFHIGPGFWVDLNYNIRSIGFLSTNSAEQIPLQSANFAIKYLF